MDYHDSQMFIVKRITNSLSRLVIGSRTVCINHVERLIISDYAYTSNEKHHHNWCHRKPKVCTVMFFSGV